MVIELTAEQEAQLLEIASLSGRPADEIASEVLLHALADRLAFVTAVQKGREAADRGEVVQVQETGAGLENILRA